jgi:hypothetical protein
VHATATGEPVVGEDEVKPGAEQIDASDRPAGARQQENPAGLRQQEKGVAE